MSAGAYGYLMKDDPGDELKLAIKKIHEGKFYLSPSLADEFADEVLTAPRNNEISPFKGLTSWEKEVLHLIVEGLTSRAIAGRLCLSLAQV